jgi:hypothetical protein
MNQRLYKIGRVAQFLCVLRLTPNVGNELMKLFIYSIDNDTTGTRFDEACSEVIYQLPMNDADSLLFGDFDTAVEFMSSELTR